MQKKNRTPLAKFHALLGKMATEIQIGCLEHLRIVRAFFSLLLGMVRKMIDLVLPRRRPALAAAVKTG